MEGGKEAGSEVVVLVGDWVVTYGLQHVEGRCRPSTTGPIASIRPRWPLVYRESPHIKFQEELIARARMNANLTENPNTVRLVDVLSATSISANSFFS